MKTAIVSALYDAELDTAQPAMNANTLALKVGPLLGIKCRLDPLWQIVREMVRNRIDGADRLDMALVHVVGCDSTGHSLVQLTGLGLAAARREYANRQQALAEDQSRPLTPAEIASAVGISGLPVLA